MVDTCASPFSMNKVGFFPTFVFSGLFFGKKRASHPNMNNLLFGRRSSYASDANGQQTRGLERAYALCMNIKKTCESLALTEANELPEH